MPGLKDVVEPTVLERRAFSGQAECSGRRAKARLILRVSQILTSSTLNHILRRLPVKACITVLQSVRSYGHKLQFGDVQQAFNTGDPIKREQPLFVRMPLDGVPGESRDVWVQLFKTARENGGIVFLLQPEDWVLRRPY